MQRGHEAIARYERVLRHFQAATRRDIPLQVVQAFTEAALEEGQTLTELTRKLGAKPSTASRQLLDPARSNRLGDPGYGLIDVLKRPLDRGANSYVLSPKGRELAMTLSEVMRGRGTTS